MIGTRLTILISSALLLLQACGSEDVTVDRKPPGPRSRGPQVDMTVMLEDPRVATFDSQASEYRMIMTELRGLEARMADTGLVDEDQARWEELHDRAAAEKGRLNAMIYAPGVGPDQRAAMWWLMQPESSE